MIIYKKYKKLVLLLIFCILIQAFLPLQVFATADSTDIMSDVQGVATYKVWTIKFTKDFEFDMNTIKSINIYDESNNALDDIKIFKFNKNTINIYPPSVGYTLGKKYVLRIDKSLKSLDGKNLNRAIEKAFYVTSTEPPKEPPFEKNLAVPSISIGSDGQASTAISERSKQELINIAKKIDKPYFNKYQKEAMIFNYLSNSIENGDITFYNYVYPSYGISAIICELLKLTNAIDEGSEIISKYDSKNNFDCLCVKINGQYYYFNPVKYIYNSDDKSLSKYQPNVRFDSASIYRSGMFITDNSYMNISCNDDRFLGEFNGWKIMMYDNRYITNDEKKVLDLTNLKVSNLNLENPVYHNNHIMYSNNKNLYIQDEYIPKDSLNPLINVYKFNSSDGMKLLTKASSNTCFSDNYMYYINDQKNKICRMNLSNYNVDEILDISSPISGKSILILGCYYIYFYNDSEKQLYQIDKMNYKNHKILMDSKYFKDVVDVNGLSATNIYDVDIILRQKDYVTIKEFFYDNTTETLISN